MTHPVEISISQTDPAGLAGWPGRVAILIGQNGRLPGGLPRPTREASAAALASDAWKGVKPGKSLDLAFPAGLAAEALQLVNLPRDADALTARQAGAAIGAKLGKTDLLVLAAKHPALPRSRWGWRWPMTFRPHYKTQSPRGQEGDGRRPGAEAWPRQLHAQGP